MNAQDRADERVRISLSTPHRTRAQREGRPTREIACRRCARWTRWVEVLDQWVHEDDETPACVNPATLQPYSDEPAQLPYTPTRRTPREQVQVQRIIDRQAQQAGLRLCLCNRWMNPADMDDLDTCGMPSCRDRALVNP